MSLQAKTFLNFIAGALAGAFTWMLTDLTGWFRDIFNPGQLVAAGSHTDIKLHLYGALFGMLLGLMLGLIEALSLDSDRQFWSILLQGAVIGFFGGIIGMTIGQSVFSIFVHTPAASSGEDAAFLPTLFGRAFGWSLIGGAVGAVPGISRRSAKLARQGAFGGLVGGLLGGALFQIIVKVFNTVPHIDTLSRFAALITTGALVGFFAGLVQNIFKETWIRVVLGKNEGKEYLVYKPTTTIGRSELADIGLFGDKEIAPTHAVIESIPAQHRHRLRHTAEEGERRSVTYPPTVVNGQPVTSEQWLVHGDTIQIGKRTLLFQEKATRSLTPAPVTAQATQSALSPAWPPAPSVLPPLQIAKPSLTPSDDILAQMGTAPTPGDLRPMPAPSIYSEPTQIITSPTTPSVNTGRGTHLSCLTGPYKGQSFLLNHITATIGRSTGSDISLSVDNSVSRNHAIISYKNGRHVLADDMSSNGVFVNNMRITNDYPLSIGDVIKLGDTQLRYE